MPRATPLPLRQTIWARHSQGQDAPAIAADLQLPLRTVQYLLQRFRERPEALRPAYRSGPQPTAPLWETVLDYRTRHPAWGAELIRIFLEQQAEAPVVPCTRTLQRWLRRAGRNPAPPGRKPPYHCRRADAPHQVWEMDAAERLPLLNGQEASWLRLVDECSGAFLQTRVSPPRALAHGRGRLGPRTVA